MLVHRQSVAAAIASRQRLLRQFVTVVRCAEQLAAILINPLLAFPAALKFLRFVLQEIRSAAQAAP